ncbi:MAG: hypothetical protein WBP29_09850 [Candidatus Zixiibacteriota bacterium]
MPDLVKKCFSEADFEAIKNAVSLAESRTSGEIVIRLASRSRSWLLDRLFAAGIISLIAIAISLWVTRDQNWGTYYNFTQATLWGVVGLLAGFFGAGSILQNPARRRRIVWDRALKLFAALTPTRESTGVLIFVSLTEKCGVIVADKIIASKLPSDYWDHPQSMLQDAINHDRHSEGIISAVREIGARLSEHFPHRADDTNELPDRPEIV